MKKIKNSKYFHKSETMSNNDKANQPDVFEVVEEEEPPYKKRRLNPVERIVSVAAKPETKPIQPPSYPRPDPSCFLTEFAPPEPMILLPLHFKVDKELKTITEIINEYLSNVQHTAGCSIWSGFCNPLPPREPLYELETEPLQPDPFKDMTFEPFEPLPEIEPCSFYIRIYKSRKNPETHIVETQYQGDGWVFGDFFRGLRAALT